MQEAVLGEEEVGAQHAAGEGDGEDRDVLDPDEERVGDGVLHVQLVREQVVGEEYHVEDADGQQHQLHPVQVCVVLVLAPLHSLLSLGLLACFYTGVRGLPALLVY